MRLISALLCMSACALAAPAAAATIHADVTLATPTGPGAAVGTITVSDSRHGAVFKLNLHGLPAGRHGFHIHQNGTCQPGPGKDGAVMAAGAAGGHMDPTATGKHEGPMGMGHLGDLPLIDVAADGTAHATLTAPHIEDVAAIKGHALMIHAGGDNYSDTPAPLGGGGARLACGVLE